MGDRLDPQSKEGFEEILTVVERSLPIEAIYADYSSAPQSFEEKQEISYEILAGKLQNLYALVSATEPMDKESFSRMILGLSPFKENRDHDAENNRGASVMADLAKMDEAEKTSRPGYSFAQYSNEQ